MTKAPDPAVARLGPPQASPFEAGGVLGRGGMGEVRLAYDPRLGRDVAMKTVAPGDGAAAARLAREARLTARLEHPGIMPVYEAGRAEDGRPWYAMRLFVGRSLAEAIAEATGVGDRIRLVRHVLDAAEAIAYAHGQGILHRDLTPANVLTGPFGQTLVADWGLACTLEEARTGEATGSPGYASPEQRAGTAVDVRADVYGLGAILGTVLAGHAGGAMEGPRELVAIAERATQTDPAMRYPDARAFADDLLAWFEGRRVVAHEYTPGELLRRLIRAWRVPIGVAAAGLVAVAIAGAVGWSATAEERARAEASEEAAREAQASEARAFAAALRVQASIAMNEGFSREAEILAAQALRRDETPEARGVLAAAYGRPRWPAAAGWTPPACRRSALSPDGKLATCTTETEARVYDAETGRALSSAAGKWVYAGFAGDDAHLVLVSEAGAQVAAWTPGSEPVPVGKVGARWGPFAPSSVAGFQAVYGSSDLLLVDVAAGAAEVRRPCGGPGSLQTAMLEGEDTFVAACNDGRVLRVSGPETQVLTTIPTSDGVPEFVAGLSGGRVLVGTVRGYGTVLGQDGTVLLRRRLGAESVYTAAVMGEKVAIGLSNLDLVVWDLAADTTPMRFRGQGILAAWIDPTRLRVFGPRVEDYVVPEAPWPHRLPFDVGISALAFAPDGASLAVATGSGRVALVDPATGMVRRWLDGGEGVAKDVAFAADGRLAVASAGTRQRIWGTDGGVIGGAEGFAARRVAWFATSGWYLAPYALELVRVDGTGVAHVLGNLGFADLEVNLAGTRGVGLDSTDQIWLGEDGDEVRWRKLDSLGNGRGVAMAGEHVFAANETEVRRYTGSEVTWRAPVPADVTELAASPDGRWVAVGLLDGGLLVYAVGEETPRARMHAHEARLAALAFSPDGRWLASGGWDDQVRLWSVAAFDADAKATAGEVEAAWRRSLGDVLQEFVAWSTSGSQQPIAAGTVAG